MIIRTVGQAVKDRPLVSVAPSTIVRDACDLLGQENVGALGVVDDTGLVGVLSERDVIRRVIVAGKSVDTTQVGEVMTPDPQTVGRETSLVIAMDLMMRGGFRHLPIIDDGHVYGMLSIRDIPGQYRLLYERYEAAFTELDELVAQTSAR